MWTAVWTGSIGLAFPTMITSLGRRLPLLLGLMALCIAACSSGSPHATVLTRPSSSLTPTAAASTPAPAPSPTSTAAVEAGLRAWIAAANKAFATGDTTDLRASTDKSCTCLSIAVNIEKAWREGRVRGLTWTLVRLLSIEINSHIATAQYEYAASAYELLKSDGRSTHQLAQRVTVFAQFALHADEWRLWNYTRTKVMDL